MEKLWLIFHIIGTVFGAGSVTTAYARELYFKKHPELLAKRGSLPVITPLLNIGFGLTIISGFGLLLQDPDHASSPVFWIKMGMVLILLANHIAINSYIRPRRETLPTLALISDYVSLLGWYAIIIVSVFI